MSGKTIAKHRAPRQARRRRPAARWALLSLPIAVLVMVMVPNAPWPVSAAPGGPNGDSAEPVPGRDQTLAVRRSSEQRITVTARSARATVAVVQRWERDGGTWVRVGGRMPAEVGAQGLTRRPREGVAATPIGTFTITQTLGAYANTDDRVTRMAYHRTNYGDAWGSDPHRRATYNRLYNCHCDAGELYRLRESYFRYALLIDYNRDPIVPGAGSGFFVHVSDGLPTAGCVGIRARDLARILAWLDPAARPQITIRVVH